MKHRVFVLIAAAAVLSSCGTKSSSDRDDPDDDRSSEPRPGASPLGSLGLFSSLLSSRMDEPGPYDEPTKSKGFDDDEAHFAVLELEGPIVELKSFSLLGGSSGVELRAITDRLDKLARDDSVTGLVIRSGDLGLSMATAEELRAALVRFKTDGGATRKLYCHTEGLSNTTYYLLSACDSIGLAPTGQIVISGVAAMPLHLKGLLDKVGVRADFLHIGDFKGAAEPLTLDAPSPAMVETISGIMDEAYATMVDGIASGRALSPDKVRSLIDVALYQDDAAVKAGLVDEVAVYEVFRDKALAASEWHDVSVDGTKKRGMASLMKLVGLTPTRRPSGDHIAVVYAVGSVVDGKGGGSTGARAEIASRPLAAAFRVLAADESVKAIVFRNDSGGGSALSSEIIWNAVAEAKARKPVVVSMGSVAASGGYYIACAATKVFALRNTLTGSIGVVGGKLAIDAALDKVGVKAYPMGRGKRALMWSSLGLWSDDERGAIRATMEAIYKTFVGRVATGRGKSYEEIHAIAQGRVWTGGAAKNNGLVDEIGGLPDAIAEAYRLAGIDDSAEIEVYPKEPTLLDMVESFGAVSMPFGLDSAITGVADELGVRGAEVVARYLRSVASFGDTPIQTALLLPVVVQ